jgi:hypothetical protein
LLSAPRARAPGPGEGSARLDREIVAMIGVAKPPAGFSLASCVWRLASGARAVAEREGGEGLHCIACTGPEQMIFFPDKRTVAGTVVTLE